MFEKIAGFFGVVVLFLLFNGVLWIAQEAYHSGDMREAEALESAIGLLETDIDEQEVWPEAEVTPSALNLRLVDPFAHLSNVRPEDLLPESQGDGILPTGRVDTAVGGGQHVAHIRVLGFI